MNWSFRIARIFGTDVKVHFTFLLLLGFLWFSLQGSGGVDAALTGMIFFLTLFLCVVLHEFGHILMARRFGIRTPDVILLPIGGVARLERIPEEPRRELLIALAGPAVTAAIAAGLYAWLTATGHPVELFTQDLEKQSLPQAMLDVNLLLLGFNLIPAFPLDGGRVLRALLSTRMSHVRATRLAAGAGQALAMVLGVAGLFFNPMWLLIALFVFVGASQEAAQVETRAAGRGIVVDQMMITRYVTIPATSPLRQAVELLLEGEQREFPVVDAAGRVEGLLTRENLIKGLAEKGPDVWVSQAMTRDVPTLPLGLDFDTAYARLRQSGLPALPVANPSGALVGLLTMDNITDLILVRQAVAK